MQKVINPILLIIIIVCLCFPSNLFDPVVPPNINTDKAVVMGIFVSLGDELDKDKDRDEPVFVTLVDAYGVIIESTNKTMGHPIHEIEGMEDFGTELGVEIERIVPDASTLLTNKQKTDLSKLFKKTSKELGEKNE